MAALSPVANVETFLLGLEKSGLLTADRLAAARDLAAKVSDPKALARELIKSDTLTKWQANQLLHGYHLLTMGKFNLLDQVGASEMGRVYLAEHAQIGRRHTLKVLAKRHASNPEVVQKFLAEATLACGLDHRNISHIYDVNQDGDRCYMVSEHVEGEDLKHFVERSGKLPLPQAAEAVRQAAEGLAHAHENGVIHGGLRPANLLIEPDGTLKILDFGQSGLLAPAGAGGVDESQEVATSAQWHRAPERRTGQQPPNVAGDVYSLGSIFCFLLTGQSVENESAAAPLLAALDLPPEAIDFCRRLMADEPAQRPQTMQQVLADLAELGRDREKPVPPKKKPPVAKPPVAKPLTESAALPVAKRLDADPTAATQTAKAAKPGKSADAKSKAPLIIAGAIGGGVLVLGGLGVLIAWFAFGGSGKQVAQVPKEQIPAAAKGGEANPAEANPVEANPVEANPVTSNPPQPALPSPPASPPPSTPAITTPAATVPAKTNPPPGPTESEPKTTPPPPVTETPPPQPETLPPKAKTPDAKPPAKPAPKATPKTETKAKPKAEPVPFAGFARTASLPPLTDAMGQRMAEALTPLVLGPCRVDKDAALVLMLKGGDTSIRGGKQKFELRTAGAAMPPREWEIQLTGGEAPATVATLAAKDNGLAFQWTEEAVKQAAQAKLLCNCAVELAMGAAKHQVALRQPASGPSLAVDFEKNATVKWTIESLPDPKNIQIEATRFDGLAKQKVEPANSVPLSDDLVVWTGPTDDKLFLSLKLTLTSQARGIQLASAPQARLPGMTKPVRFSKKEATNTRLAADATLAGLTTQLNVLSKQKSRAGDPTDVMKNQVKAKLDETHKGVADLEVLLNFLTAVQGTAKIQFRVYHQAGDAQIDLLLTSDNTK